MIWSLAQGRAESVPVTFSLENWISGRPNINLLSQFKHFHSALLICAWSLSNIKIHHGQT
jgi:hypothetical protein